MREHTKGNFGLFFKQEVIMDNKLYDYFLDWCEGEGLPFPCTPSQFYERACRYTDDGELIDMLCEYGIGADWQDAIGLYRVIPEGIPYWQR